MLTKDQGISDQGASDQGAQASYECNDNHESTSPNSNKLLEDIEIDTRRANMARKVSFFILLVLMIFGIISYTARYLDKEENKSVNTEHKKKTQVGLPVFLMKSYKKWIPESLSWSNGSDVSLTIIEEKPTMDNVTNRFLTYQWYDWSDELYHTAIIPPKKLYLNIGTEDYLTLRLYVARALETAEFTMDAYEKREFFYMASVASDYKCWIPIFHRNEFLEYLRKDHAVIFGGGLNAHLMITPLNVYDVGLEVEMIKNKIKSKRKTKYSMSFNGVAADKDLVDYDYDNDNHTNYTTIYYDTILYLNAPIDSRVSKFVISKKYNIFDILSSIGGLRSLASLILTYIFSFIIYGTGITWLEKLLKICPFKFWKLCPYAQDGDQTKTRNEAIKTNVILSRFKQGDQEYDSYIPPKVEIKRLKTLDTCQSKMDTLQEDICKFPICDQIKISKN